MQSSGFTGGLLDRYLANGWYRMGTRMFTCRYNFYDWGFLSTVWTRLPLADHAYPRSTRKVMRRAAARFRHEVHPARAGAEEERVYVAYRDTKPYDLAEDAASYLEYDPQAPFTTYQTSVYDGDTLVAFSYFDLGKAAVQSLTGFYDPAYDKYSLGLYTLTLEVDWCKARGYDFHYAGYIVPDNDIFEYKRRTGRLEFYNDVLRLWLPIELLQRDQLPDEVQRDALSNYHELYTALGVDFEMRMRPQFFIGITQQDLAWLRREQLPYALTDGRANRRPFWACHFYSYNFKRYFSLLCTTHAFSHEAIHLPDALRSRAPSRSKRYEFIGSGMAVRLLHYTTRPYTARDMKLVWDAVERENAAHYRGQ